MNRKTAIKTACAIALAILALAGFLGWRIVTIAFTEDFYCRAGTFDYLVAIRSPLIKDFPQMEIVGEPLYYSSGGDGPKPAGNGVSYLSSAAPSTILPTAQQHIKNYGFVFDAQEGKMEYVFRKEDYWVRLRLSESEAGTQLSVRELWR